MRVYVCSKGIENDYLYAATLDLLKSIKKTPPHGLFRPKNLTTFEI